MSRLVDTSVWVELFRGRQKINFESLLSFSVCPPIIQEILQGLSNDRLFEVVKSGLLALPCLAPKIDLSTFVHAADIYRSGRIKGLRIRSSVDCLIAAIAIENNVEVLHRDRDFETIASYTKLRESSLGKT